VDVHLLLAALAGGVAFFVWGAISWMALPWHRATYSGFANEDDVVKAIEANAPTSGIYTLPKPECGKGAATPEARKAAQQAAWDKMKKGPLVQAVVQRRGTGSMGPYMLRGFLLGVVVAGLLAWLLEKTAIVAMPKRAAFVALAALAGNVAARVSDWNWHGYPTRYTLINLVDAAVGWFAAGLAIAAVLPGAG
jgi:hypothetical protein